MSTTTIAPKDSTSIESATRPDYPKGRTDLLFWDEGHGPLWAFYVNAGHFGFLRGIVRASSFEEAFECVVDEIAEDPDPGLMVCYETRCAIVSYFNAEDCLDLPEGVEIRSNGVPSNDCGSTLETNYAFLEPMGHSVIPLTIEIMDREKLNIQLRA